MLSTEKHGIKLKVHPGESELLVEVFLGKRTQQVSVTMKPGKKAGGQLVRLLSRACVVSDHKLIRSALAANSNLELGGVSLDMSTEPPVIDVVHNLAAKELVFQEFAQSLFSVARYADFIESKFMGGADVF